MSDEVPQMPAFIADDSDALEALDQLDAVDLILAAQLFDGLCGPFVPAAVVGWAKWWRWLLHERLFDRPGQLQPDDALPASDLTPTERTDLIRCFQRVADADSSSPGLSRFARLLLVQLLDTQLRGEVDDDQATARLKDWLAWYRREIRPHGSPFDCSRLPPWSEVDGTDT